MSIEMDMKNRKNTEAYVPGEAGVSFRDLDFRQRPALERQGHRATMATTMIDLMVGFVRFEV
jgi:hypothetical protein